MGLQYARYIPDCTVIEHACYDDALNDVMRDHPGSMTWVLIDSAHHDHTLHGVTLDHPGSQGWGCVHPMKR